jgi:hypothetical protein
MHAALALPRRLQFRIGTWATAPHKIRKIPGRGSDRNLDASRFDATAMRWRSTA